MQKLLNIKWSIIVLPNTKVKYREVPKLSTPKRGVLNFYSVHSRYYDLDRHSELQTE
jgi:hypothetical protein